ncbi:DNA-binding response regulator [Eubacterium sp. am_0171]|uniref:Stage 0 sporulation protein A homolog n=1 Tax=Faecalicatena contorta TaxID=39482 RepID=A0A174DUC5_9FIRM|nr:MULTISPECIES: response regulator transcription factor [Clostridia]MSC83285.1 response regulator [Eubacterium sp. BIOML-A1]MSD05840.1 response regulator [Eubacterium sp. BIOML-A2]RYT23745.1 DNA-binding response regulator [Eubacterium sp. am_0171]CUO27859.1 Glycopeptide resistance-associated protein R [[Eubacterium] contortum] [Faecalicatena contorta]
MYRILIVEDEKDIRLELKLMLENALYQAEAAEDFSDIPRLVDETAPDLILLDIQLPETDGLKVCRDIRKKTDVPIIFVTSRSNSMDELNGMMMGGDDYVTKPYQAPILLARIAAVLKRTGHNKAPENPCRFTWKGCELDMLQGTLTYEGRSEQLTRNELRICCNLFSRAGQIISREELIDDLWENQIFIDDNTLSVNITRIRGKMKEIGLENLIVTRRGQGYQL